MTTQPNPPANPTASSPSRAPSEPTGLAPRTIGVYASAPIWMAGLPRLLDDQPGVRVVWSAATWTSVPAAMATATDVVLVQVDERHDEGITPRLRRRFPEALLVALSASKDDGPARSVQLAGADVVLGLDADRAALLRVVHGTEAAPVVLPVMRQRVLTVREREVLQLLAGGLTSSQLAMRLGISAHTVESHKQRIYRRLQVQGQAQAVAVAIREGLIAASTPSGRSA